MSFNQKWFAVAFFYVMFSDDKNYKNKYIGSYSRLIEMSYQTINTHLCHSSIDDFLLINYTIKIYASLPINSKRFNKEIDLK